MCYPAVLHGFSPFTYYISDTIQADHDIVYSIDGGGTRNGTGVDAIQLYYGTLAGSLDVLLSSQPQVQQLGSAIATSTVQYVHSLNTTVAECVNPTNSLDCTASASTCTSAAPS